MIIQATAITVFALGSLLALLSTELGPDVILAALAMLH